MKSCLRIDGLVGQPVELTFEQLAAFDAAYQIPDVSRLHPQRKGDAVSLLGLLQLVQPRPEAAYLGLHSAADNFHASVPLGPVRERGILIYRQDGQPLSTKSGGPFRFFIPDHASCRTDEIDECANVKFVDHIELTADKGFDNRPHDEGEHAALHAKEG